MLIQSSDIDLRHLKVVLKTILNVRIHYEYRLVSRREVDTEFFLASIFLSIDILLYFDALITNMIIKTNQQDHF